MFTVIKLIKPFLLPPTLIAVGMLTSLLLLVRKKQGSGKTLLLLTLVTYYLLSIEPFAYLLVSSLEDKVNTAKFGVESENAEVIVVLAGGAGKKGKRQPFPELSGTSWKRLWHGIELFKEFNGGIPMLYSGGSGNPFDPVSVEAELAREYAVSMDIPDENFWIEKTSRNTYESGIAIKRILDERFPSIENHRIILVTSATHMPRSVAVMEKLGFDAIPSPADFPFSSLNINLLSFIPSVQNFFTSCLAINEWVGLGGYWLLGRI